MTLRLFRCQLKEAQCRHWLNCGVPLRAVVDLRRRLYLLQIPIFPPMGGEGGVPEERRRVVAEAQATADPYKDFDPSRETWEDFGRRVVQAERTLTWLGFGVDVHAAEKHMRRSAVIKEMIGMGPNQQVSHLKQAYAFILLDPTADMSGLRKPILEELLTQRGLRIDDATIESLLSGTSSSAPGSEGSFSGPGPADSGREGLEASARPARIGSRRGSRIR